MKALKAAVLLLALSCEWPYPPWYGELKCPETARDSFPIAPMDSAAARNICSETAKTQSNMVQVEIFLRERCLTSYRETGQIWLYSFDLNQCRIVYHPPDGSSPRQIP